MDKENRKNCKLVNILRTFDREEFRNFEKIAVSPYFSSGRNYRPYVEALKKFYPEFNGDMQYRSRSRKLIFEKVHPGRKYNDQYMKNIFTDLIHFAEETLLQSVTRKHNHENLASLAIEEAKRNLFPLANQNIRRLDSKLDESGIDEIYFYCKGMGEIAYSILFNKSRGKNHISGIPFSTGEYFIFFSLITLALSIYNTSVRRLAICADEEIQFNEAYAGLVDLYKLEKLLSDSKTENKEIILIFIYYLIHKTRKPSYSNYKKMKNLVMINYPRLNKRMLFYTVSLMFEILNDLRETIRESVFRKEMQSTAEFSLANECYKIMKTSVFPYQRFRTYYKNAIALGKTTWVKEFLAKYSHELPGDIRPEAESLVSANILFENGRFEEALELLKFKSKDIYSNLDRRLLKIKILFNKKSLIQASENLDAFKKFVSHNKEAKRICSGNFILFIKYCRTLINSEDKTGSDIKHILRELHSAPAFPEKRWLTEKFEKVH